MIIILMKIYRHQIKNNKINNNNNQAKNNVQVKEINKIGYQNLKVFKVFLQELINFNVKIII